MLDADRRTDTSSVMHSLDTAYSAVVIGASGGIGSAFVRALSADPACETVHALARAGAVPEGPAIRPGAIDLTDEASIAAAAEAVGPGPRLVIVAAGFLHGSVYRPEKGVRDLSSEGFAKNFALNATGPALAIKHFLPLMPREGRTILAALSARVGSISDNRIGGWYGYRAAKAALNQILRCTAIEAARKRPDLVVAGLQPGTVRTPLSAPFRASVPEGGLFEPDDAAARLLGVLDALAPARSGRLFDWSGEEIAP